jgi:hypothetical protein
LDGVSDPSLVDEHRQRAALVFDQLTIGELTEKTDGRFGVWNHLHGLFGEVWLH